MKNKNDQLPETMNKDQQERAEFVPAVDIYEQRDGIKLYCDLPGVDLDHLHITLENQELVIHGEQNPVVQEGMDCMIDEYHTGTFVRTFKLTQEIDQNAIQAVLRNGVLELTLPKAQSAQPKKIEVTVQ